MNYFILSYNRAPIGDSHDAKLEFDFTTACKKCGTGAKLVGSLKLSGINKLTKDFFETYVGDYIISENLYNSLIRENIVLGNLKKVTDSNNTEQPYYHLSTNLILPPALKKDGLAVENQCSECKRNGFFYKLSKSKDETIVFPTGIQYTSNQILVMEENDFYLTWECFGYSNLVACGNNVVGYARPLLIVSEKFKIALEKFKVKGLIYELIIVL